MIDITRFSIKNHALSPCIKFLWHMGVSDADFHYKLLPTDCIDIIINMGSRLIYETESGKILAPPIHINNLRSGPCHIRQKNDICIYGISFYSYGLFPFIRQPVAELKNTIIDLHELSLPLAQKLHTAGTAGVMKTDADVKNGGDVNTGMVLNTGADVKTCKDVYPVIENIEQALAEELTADPTVQTQMHLISDFLEYDGGKPIRSFCEANSVNPSAPAKHGEDDRYCR